MSFVYLSPFIYNEDGVGPWGIVNQGDVKASFPVMWKVCVLTVQKVFKESIASLFCQDTARISTTETGRYLDT